MLIVKDAPSWVAQYIGIPYKEFGYDREGCTCWGLVRLVEMEQFNIELERHDEIQFWGRSMISKSREQMVERVKRYIESGEWSYVDKRNMQPSDIVHLRVLGEPVHVGIAVSRTHMLHVQDKAAATCESIYSTAWEHRVLSVFRHKSVKHA